MKQQRSSVPRKAKNEMGATFLLRIPGSLGVEKNFSSIGEMGV